MSGPLALPPPSGTAAGPRRPPAPRPGPAAHGCRSLALRSLRLPPHQWRHIAVTSLARPCRRPWVVQPGPVPRSVPYPQFRMQFPDTCSSSLSEKPGISTITFQSMKCARGNCMRMCVDQDPSWSPGIGNLSRETAIAFARMHLYGIETAIAFAGEKWVFLVRFLVAVVLLVSMVAVQGRALVMVVSCWPASVSAEVSLVSKSPCRASCARKSSPCSACCWRQRYKVRHACEKWPKIGGLWRDGRIFSRKCRWRGHAGRTFSRVSGGEGVLGEFCRAYRHGSHVSQVTWRPTCRKWWGFCSIRS